GGLTFEPACSGGDARYHLYLRLSDEEIAFAGSDPGVPNRQDGTGWSFLTGLWGSGGHATYEEFLLSAHTNAVRAARAGLLNREEAVAVLEAAASSTLDGSGPRASAFLPDSDAGPVLRDGVVEWSLPGDIGAQEPLPVLRVDVLGERAPSGWYTSAPAFKVSTVQPADLEAALGDADWSPVTAEVQAPGEGRHVLRARATDPLGRVVHARAEVSVDSEPPTPKSKVRSLGPSNVEVTLDATDDVSGVDRIRWRTAETFWGVYQEPFTRALHDEPQVLEFTATDRAGNTSQVHRVVLPPRQA
ncbi:OmpL47-type beta-barrel domain-containing protein, partial [Actinosynnema sp.]|uniref:OmpL47-type beta-barrel domain-containing protein n=1 Tax=Actinosynnema sp. TaxID=1872144 RepID=UPI003F8327A7